MEEVIQALFNAGFTVWDACLKVAGGSFSESPENNPLWSMVKTLYTTVKMGAIPLATLFFIIAIYKSVVSSPPEQALKKFLSDGIRYALILFVIDKLDTIIEAIMEYSNIFVQKMGGPHYTFISGSADVATLTNKISELKMDLSTVDAMNFGATIETFFKQMGPYILFFVAGVITVLVLIGSGLSIIGIAYERIIKPLAILPLSTVILSMSCCSDEGSKTMWSMGKSFFGFCIAGAFFVLAINMGTFAGTKIADMAPLSGASDYQSMIITIARANIGAIITTGLLKSMNAMIERTFG